jgi:hypothetical protein
MKSKSTYTTTHDDGTKICVTITVEQDHEPTWAKWLRVYLESPIAYGLTKEE